MIISAAAGEQMINDTAATHEYVSFPWMPSADDNIKDLGELDWITELPPREEKPKRKSKWLLKQMGRRGHKK